MFSPDKSHFEKTSCLVGTCEMTREQHSFKKGGNLYYRCLLNHSAIREVFSSPQHSLEPVINIYLFVNVVYMGFDSVNADE